MGLFGKKAKSLLGQLQSEGDYRQAVDIITKATAGNGMKGEMGVIMTMGRIQALNAGKAQPNDVDKRVLAGMKQLAEHGEPAAKVMVDVLLNVKGPEKAVATEVLHLIGQAAIPAIAAGLSGPPSKSRKLLVRPLARIGGADAVQVAKSAAADSDPSVAESAQALVEGKPLPGMDFLQGVNLKDKAEREVFAVKAMMWLHEEGFVTLDNRLG